MSTGCERKMGLLRGLEIQQLIEGATGEPCPCKIAKGCPLGIGGRVGAQRVEAPNVPRRKLDLGRAVEL